MKAAVLHGVNDLRLDEVPRPGNPDAHDVLVEITVCGLCGTDVHMWAGTNQEGTFPFVPGHEWSGQVVAVGSNVRHLKPGDRVTGEPFVGCRNCDVCHNGQGPAFCPNHRYYGFTPDTPGGLAEFHLSPAERLHKIPDNLSDEVAALTEPVSVAYHSVWGIGGGSAPHDRIVIFGAGPIGLFALQTCLTSGADVIVVEPAPYRQRMAQSVGAKTIIDPSSDNVEERIMDLTRGLGATKIIECSGSVEATAMTVDIVSVDGNIVLTGQSVGTKVPIEIGKTIWKHATISGYAGAHFYFPKTLAFMAKKLVDFEKVITHRFSIDDIAEAFDLCNRGTESAKVMIYPNRAMMPV
jgi:2-desacetyl-2-hydroxyethyl bacteriochlorophyllide A dehydrogenase